jgi:hypothetical protein
VRKRGVILECSSLLETNCTQTGERLATRPKRQLFVISLLTLPDPGIVCTVVQRGVVPERSSLLEIYCVPTRKKPFATVQSTTDRYPSQDLVIVPERSSFFLVRLTVALRPLLREGHCHYSLKTVSRRSQAVSRHCARRATIFTKRKIPRIQTSQARVTTKFTKRGISW